MASIYRRGNVWWILYYINGLRFRQAIGKNRKDAIAFKAEIEYRLSKGQIEDPKGKNKDISIEAARIEFFRKLKVYVREKTLQNYRLMLNRFFGYLKNEGITRLSEITKESIEEYISARKEEETKRREKIRNSTLNLQLKTVKLFLKKCVESGLLKLNTAAGIKPIKSEKRLPFFFSEEQLSQIFNSSEPTYYKKVYLFLLLSGIRVGELCNLTHNDIDLEGRRIFIRENPDWKPKTGERTIPISEELALLIESLEKRDKRYLFVNERGEKLTVHGLDTRFIRLRRELGLERGSLHTFRHTYATLITMKTGNIRALQMILGHQKIETTQIYSHLTDDYLKAVSDEMNLGVATILATISKNKAGRRKGSC